MKANMNLENLEKAIQNRFRPLEPDPVFINHLKARFNRDRDIILEPVITYRRVFIMASMLAAAAGIFTVWLIKNIKS